MSTPSSRPSRRDHALDALRGVFIVSMTFQHLAPEAAPTAVIHAPVAFDGASGFVLMSGLVLGIVQSGRLRRGGEHGALRALLRRAGLLYVLHVGLVGLTLLVGLTSARAAWMPRVGEFDSPVEVIWRLLALEINPQYVDILSMYAVLLLIAAAGVVLMRRGLVAVLIAASLLAWLLSQTAPDLVTMRNAPGGLGHFSWGGWQLIFVSAFIVGWYWRRRRLATVLRSAPVLVVSAVLVLGLSAYGALASLAVVSRPVWDQLADKGSAGPIRVAMAWAGFALLYAAATTLLRRVPWLVDSVVERIGRRSLNCFVIMTIIVAVFGGLVPDRGNDVWNLVLPWVALLLMVQRVRAHERRTSRHLVRLSGRARARHIPSHAARPRRDALRVGRAGRTSGAGPADSPRKGRSARDETPLD